jgi:hypothetical protein
MRRHVQRIFDIPEFSTFVPMSFSMAERKKKKKKIRNI